MGFLKIRAQTVLHVATLVAMAFALWMMFVWVPTDINQGVVQRILYIHVPVAWVSMVAIIGVAAASVAYLITKRETWDRIAASMAEVGVMFGAIMLISGMVWAKPVWEVWWDRRSETHDRVDSVLCLRRLPDVPAPTSRPVINECDYRQSSP